MPDDTLERTGGRAAGSDGSDSGTVVVDPRMRQRRDEVRREEGRRRRHRSLWIVVPLLLVAALFGLAHTPLLDVDRIEVEGAARTPTPEIVAASRLGRGQPLLTLDQGGAERRIRALPWVADAEVTREWPGGVRVAVTERTPAATVALENPGGVAWVDADGRVLQIGGNLAEGLVTVVGVEDLPAVGEDLPAEARDAVAFAATAPARVPGVLASVSVDLEATLAAGVPGAGAVVDLYDGSSVDEKLVALDTILANVDMSCVATIDLQVPDAPAVTRQPGCD